MSTPETERVRKLWQKNASKYDRQISLCERLLFEGGREWACSRARGEVLEIAVGTGRNLEFYPAEVTLTAIDFSSAMLEVARERAASLGREVDLREADAQNLPFDDGSFDTVVSTLTMCNIPDYGRAIAEVHRVLRPGGRFVLMEHVRSDRGWVRAGQRALEPLTVRFEGDHLLRTPLEKVRAASFEVQETEQLKRGIVQRIVAVRN